MNPSSPPDAAPDRPDAVEPADALLAAIVAHHLDGASVVAGTAVVRSPDVTVECHVEDLVDWGDGRGCAASCFLGVSGGRFGSRPVFASISGYGPTPEEAVADGGHMWASMVGELLRAAAGVDPGPQSQVTRHEVVLDGRRYLLVVTGVDRGIGDLETDGVLASVRDLRRALDGEPWLLPGLAGSDVLPLLTTDEATLVSLFVGQTTAGRTVELKVHGVDWPATGALEAHVDLPEGLTGALLRELAVLVPLEPAPPLARAAVQRTLDGLATRSDDPRRPAGWPGWWVHGGALGPVLSDTELTAVEAGTGPLPDDARHFLTHVAGPGAGPGYGLLPLRRDARGVPLAHAGCGNAWVLHVDGPSRGTVWMDAPGSDRSTTQVATSVAAWFAAWLDAALREDVPWQQYDRRGCSTYRVLGQPLEALLREAEAAGEPAPTTLASQVADGAVRITGEGLYTPDGPLDPCHGCVSLAARLGLPPSVFAPGPLTLR